MARRSRTGRSQSHPSYNFKSLLETLAIALFSTVADEDDEAVAIALAALALEDNSTRSSRYGKRGPYNRAKSFDFFNLMLNDYTERQFHCWLR